MNYPNVYALTLNWNGKDDTIECVKSLKKLSYTNFQIVIVDNASTDGSVSVLKAEYPDLTIIERRQNLGYGDGLNSGLRFAYERGADYFLILNNDAIIDPEALSELVRVAQQDEKIGFVTGKVYWYAKPNTLQVIGRNTHPVTLVAGPLVGCGEVDHGQYDELKDFDFVEDTFLLVSREVYAKVGGYHPDFFFYYEVTDWCARVRKAGFKIKYTPHAKIWHKRNVGEPSSSLSPLRHYYLCRNQILFVRKNSSSAHFWWYLLWLTWKQSFDALRWARHGHFRLLMARLHGFGSGLLWVWRDWVKPCSD